MTVPPDDPASAPSRASRARRGRARPGDRRGRVEPRRRIRRARDSAARRRRPAARAGPGRLDRYGAGTVPATRDRAGRGRRPDGLLSPAADPPPVAPAALVGAAGRHRCRARRCACSRSARRRAVREAGLVPRLAQERATVTLEAVVDHRPPGRRPRPGRRRPRWCWSGSTCGSVSGRGQQSRARTPVLVFGDASWKAVRWHETVRTTGRLDVADGGDDVVAVLNPRGPTRPAARRRAGWRRRPSSVRAGLRRAVAALRPTPAGSCPLW